MSGNRTRISVGQPGTGVGPGPAPAPVFESVVDASGEEMTITPDILGVMSSDRVAWRSVPSQKFKLEFPESPFDSGGGARTLESDGSGRLGEKIHSLATGQYPYEAVLVKDPGRRVKGLLLVNVRSSIIVRGSPEPD